ncbi:hypothetical protein DAPPUDRAFT_237698 [Daphnia pulex]|uniref:Uncharacterized protein n=1 Tax=Daphnia pulex TaxID=6669 RepID=E9G5M6_DAPPU|nr:hypothetical protein DAPPUDRAFT_237698 [Daphnia pulex]|eukprot:EFX85230.1 hypothetical protein DAPPUDRAFT_237698 [Daphnia pulex]
MLIIVHDGGTSTYVLLHPYLPDVRSSNFTASVLLMLQNNFSCFTGELDHFSCCDTCSHSPRDYGQVMQMKRREDGIPRLVINVDHRDRHRDSSSTEIIVLLINNDSQ